MVIWNFVFSDRAKPSIGRPRQLPIGATMGTCVIGVNDYCCFIRNICSYFYISFILAYFSILSYSVFTHLLFHPVPKSVCGLQKGTQAGLPVMANEEAGKSSPQIQLTIKVDKIVKSNYFITLEINQRQATNWEVFIHEQLLNYSKNSGHLWWAAR